jgi:hypothetical protein
MSAIAVHGQAAGGRRDLGRGTGPSALEASIGSRAEQMESFRICAKCGVDNFAQRAARG